MFSLCISKNSTKVMAIVRLADAMKSSSQACASAAVAKPRLHLWISLPCLSLRLSWANHVPFFVCLTVMINGLFVAEAGLFQHVATDTAREDLVPLGLHLLVGLLDDAVCGGLARVKPLRHLVGV